MSEPRKTKKKVVSAPASTPSTTAKKKSAPAEPTWQASPEAKAEAKKLRTITWILWIVALAVSLFVAFWVLRQDPVNMWLLICLMVVAGALTIPGNLLWKKANRIDPASRAEPVKFFIQNQLGAIVSAIAFIPLIVLVFTNKNLSGKEKGIAGTIAILIFGGSALSGVTADPPSVEQYSDEKQLVLELMGEDKVYWTAGGKVFHLCEAVSDLQRESETNEIVVGTVDQAHEAGKNRLTKKVEQELSQCGLDPALYEQAREKIQSGTTTDPSETPSETTDETESSEPTEETE